MSVSIIIPVLNDNTELAGLLETIRSWNDQPDEILVVDAGENKDCESICSTYRAKWLPFKKTRGAQSRYGAQCAHSDVLWFLYADCRPHSDSVTAIKDSLTEHSGGFFRFSFDLPKKNLTQNILEFFINWRSRHFTAYGDQGLFFKKQAYFVFDGHTDQSLFEEVTLNKRFRQVGFKALNLPIQVSARKWAQDGYWTRTWRNRSLALRYHFGRSATELHEKYYS